MQTFTAADADVFRFRSVRFRAVKVLSKPNMTVDKDSPWLWGASSAGACQRHGRRIAARGLQTPGIPAATPRPKPWRYCTVKRLSSTGTLNSTDETTISVCMPFCSRLMR